MSHSRHHSSSQHHPAHRQHDPRRHARGVHRTRRQGPGKVAGPAGFGRAVPRDLGLEIMNDPFTALDDMNDPFMTYGR